MFTSSVFYRLLAIFYHLYLLYSFYLRSPNFSIYSFLSFSSTCHFLNIFFVLSSIICLWVNAVKLDVKILYNIGPSMLEQPKQFSIFQENMPICEYISQKNKQYFVILFQPRNRLLRYFLNCCQFLKRLWKISSENLPNNLQYRISCWMELSSHQVFKADP